MKPSGWFFLTLSWTLILAWCAFCFRRLLQTKDRKNSH